MYLLLTNNELLVIMKFLCIVVILAGMFTVVEVYCRDRCTKFLVHGFHFSCKVFSINANYNTRPEGYNACTSLQIGSHLLFHSLIRKSI